MNRTIKMCSYYLKHDTGIDIIDDICLEAQQHGCELLTGKGQVVITMWENNPYNSLFALKYDKHVRWAKHEDWCI